MLVCCIYGLWYGELVICGVVVEVECEVLCDVVGVWCVVGCCE